MNLVVAGLKKLCKREEDQDQHTRLCFSRWPRCLFVLTSPVVTAPEPLLQVPSKDVTFWGEACARALGKMERMTNKMASHSPPIATFHRFLSRRAAADGEAIVEDDGGAIVENDSCVRVEHIGRLCRDPSLLPSCWMM